jgi:hypothetical protein
VVKGDVSDEALRKADMAIQVLDVVNGWYKAMLERAALEAEIASWLSSRKGELA